MFSTYCLFSAPPLLCMHSEIAEMFADEMDLVSLSQWRASCRSNYHHASSSLQRTLTNRLNPFVAYPHKFVDIVTSHSAVFGGELALSFILRKLPYRPTFLEVYASNYQYDLLCTAILDEPSIRDRIQRHTIKEHEELHALRRLVSKSLVITTLNGQTIYIHQSYTSSPCGPISRAPCTALSNYVSGFGFGCSHPELTLARRALVADLGLLFISRHDARTLDNLLAYDFSLAISPTVWTEYRRAMEGDFLQSPEECWRDRYICPNQGRFFGDSGSLIGYFDPLHGDVDECTRRNIAPFGPMVVWRVMSTFECDDGCEYLDEVLDHGVTSVPVLFKNDPFAQLWRSLSMHRKRFSSAHNPLTRPRSSTL